MFACHHHHHDHGRLVPYLHTAGPARGYIDSIKPDLTI